MPSVLDPPILSAAALSRATGLVCFYHPCLLAPYRQTDGKWAIGWGSREMPTGGAVLETSAPIGPFAADALLKRALLAIGERVLTLVSQPLTDGQAAAVVALVYDIDAIAFHVSDLLERLCRGDHAGAGAAFSAFVRDEDGTILPELILRRAAQRRAFLSATETTS
jgi:GH24 family phage-related lysozyme (muramidase)